MKFGFLALLATTQLAFGATMPSQLLEETGGVRSQAMGGAHRGIGDANDTLTLNPGAMALSRRYGIDLQYTFLERDSTSRVSVSAVDAKSGAIAGGLAYDFISGHNDIVDFKLHRMTLGMAYNMNNVISLGVSGHYLNVKEKAPNDTREVDFRELWTADIGLAAQISSLLTLGISYHNFIETDSPHLTPPAVGIGLGINSDLMLLAFDLRVDLTESKSPKLWYHVGGEFMASENIPIRAGYKNTTFVDSLGTLKRENILSLGIGYASPQASLDCTFTKSVERHANWSGIFALRFFI